MSYGGVTIKNSDRFLTSFTRIEKELKDRIRNKRDLGFSRCVKILSKSDAVLKRYRDDLLEFAELRNAIVHNRIDADYTIAEPHLSVVEKIETIELEIMQPKRVYPRFSKKVITFQETDSLANVLQIIDEKEISRFPIYKDGKFKGLITERGITQWLAKNMRKNFPDGIETSLRDVPACQKNNTCRFIDKYTTVYEALEIFKNEIEKGSRIYMLLITENGNEGEQLLGIITPRDIIDLV